MEITVKFTFYDMKFSFYYIFGWCNEKAAQPLVYSHFSALSPQFCLCKQKVLKKSCVMPM